jgi:site-specific DNA-cytosine methylase
LTTSPKIKAPRLRFDEDLRNKLPASRKRVRLVGCDKGRAVTRPASRSTLELHATARKRQRDLDRVVSVKSSRFASKSDPQAATSPKQNASGCSWLHMLKESEAVTRPRAAVDEKKPMALAPNLDKSHLLQPADHRRRRLHAVFAGFPTAVVIGYEYFTHV